MKRKELEKIYKYEQLSNSMIINIQLDNYRDAYNDWDFSPFINRDLDVDLIDYLIACSEEIPFKYNLIINFYILDIEQDKIREGKSIIGMNNYFKYQLRQLRNKQLKIIRDILTYLLIGLLLLLISYSINKNLSDSMFLTLLAEGFSIGGWVMFWEMFESWFFERNDIRRIYKQYSRLERAKIVYSYKKEK